MSYRNDAVLAGPWGGQDGFYWDDGIHTTIKQLFISHGDVINSIRIGYDDNGTSLLSEKHGGDGGDKSTTVNLQYPDESLTSIRGYYGSLHDRGPVIILSLMFQSNKRAYGPYGIERGSPFSFSEETGKIVGFLGKCGLYLHAIGAYVQPLYKGGAPSSTQNTRHYYDYGTVEFEHSMMQGSVSSNYEKIVSIGHNKDDDKYKQLLDLPRQLSHDLSHTKHTNDHTRSKTEKIPSKNVEGVVTYGPWGGSGGSMFDDGILHDGIRQIDLKRNVCIVSIKVCYIRNGKSLWGSKNGGKGSFKKDRIVLDYPSEILTHVTGYHGPAMGFGPDVIKSLTFHTTKGRHGPYGDEQGESFSTNLKQGSAVIGFHGRKGFFIDAIGVHVLEGFTQALK